MRSSWRPLWFLAALLAGALAMAPAAAGAKAPVYRDPPTFKGLNKVPATRAPKPPAPVKLATSGTFPDALVDEAGTAHIVWNEGRGDDADAAVYCRLKRGAKSCDTTSVLTWDKTYDAGDSPSFNVDNSGPHIVRVGNQLVIFSQRYPTQADKPDGASSSTVVAWTSNDGGTTWSNAQIVGSRTLGGLVVFGSADDPTILNFTSDPLCPPGPACLEAFRSGAYSAVADEGTLSQSVNEAYDPTLTLDAGLPFAAFGDLTDHMILAGWRGTGSVTDGSQWTRTVVGGTEPHLAGGPAGLQLMSRPELDGPYRLQSVTRTAGGATVGRAKTLVGADADPVLGTLAQDASGRLTAAWEERQGKPPGVRMVTSSPPAQPRARRAAGLRGRAPVARAAAARPSLGGVQRLVDGADNGQIDLASAADGGGFAVLNHTGGINDAGQIVAAGVGTLAPTKQLGLGQLPGGGKKTNPSCQTLDFGSFDFRSAAGCFFYGHGATAGMVTTHGEVDLDGLKIVPDAGATLVIDQDKLTIQSFGSVKVLVRSPLTGDIVLFHGVIKTDLSKVVPGTDLFKFPLDQFKSNVLGFGVDADIHVKLEKDGVHIPLSLKLPAGFGGFSGKAELVADSTRGLHISSVNIHIGPLPIGVLTVDKLDIDYDGNGDKWSGDGQVTVPAGGSLEVTAEFDMGDFEEASIHFTPSAGIPIGPFVYLTRFGGEFRVSPTVVSLDADVGVGAVVDGKSPVKVSGKATMTFPGSGPADFNMSGDLYVSLIHIFDGDLDFQTDGYASFRGHVAENFQVVKIDATLNGFADPGNGQWGANFNGSLCVNAGIGCLGAAVSAAASNKGVALCGGVSDSQDLPVKPKGDFDASLGLISSWDDLKDATSFTGGFLGPAGVAAELAVFVAKHIHVPCHTSEVSEAPPRAASARGGVAAVRARAGLPTKTITVMGHQGVPDVDLQGPGGTLPGPTAGQSVTQSAVGEAFALRGINTVVFVLTDPKAGAWTVMPRAGSTSVDHVYESDGYRAAAPKATVTGKGRTRTLRYRVSNLGAGQSVRFVEQGKFGTRDLGTAKKSHGTLRIHPGTAPGGKRTIYGLVQRAGFTTDRIKLARYRAPGPARPGAVTHLRARRKGTSVLVTWKGARGASRYLIKLSGAHGRRTASLVRARARKATFPYVGRAGVKVTVAALSKTMRTGKARVVKLRTAPLISHKHKHHKAKHHKAKHHKRKHKH